MNIYQEQQHVQHLLKTIANYGCNETRTNVARNPLTPSSTLEDYVNTPNVWIANESWETRDKRWNARDNIEVAIAENPSTPEKTRRSLASNANLADIKALLRNPSISEPEVIDLIEKEYRNTSLDERIEAILRYYKPITPDIAKKALQKASKKLKQKIARTSTSPVILDALEAENNESVFPEIIFNVLAEGDRLERIYDKIEIIHSTDRDPTISLNKSTPPKVFDKMARSSIYDGAVKECMSSPLMPLETLEFLANQGRKESSWRSYETYGYQNMAQQARYAIEKRQKKIQKLRELLQNTDDGALLSAVQVPIIPPTKLLEIAMLSDDLRKAVQKNECMPIKDWTPEEFSESHSISIIDGELNLPYARELLDQSINFRRNLTDEAHEFANQLAIILLQKAKVLQIIGEKTEIGDMIQLSDTDFEVLLQNAKELRKARIVQILESIPDIENLNSGELNIDELVGKLKNQIPSISGEIDEMLRTIEVAREIRTDIPLEELNKLIEQLVDRIQKIEAKRTIKTASSYYELLHPTEIEPLGFEFL